MGVTVPVQNNHYTSVKECSDVEVKVPVQNTEHATTVDLALLAAIFIRGVSSTLETDFGGETSLLLVGVGKTCTGGCGFFFGGISNHLPTNYTIGITVICEKPCHKDLD